MGTKKRAPRTRQSPLTLAAFRPWGDSQDGRRAVPTYSLAVLFHSWEFKFETAPSG